MHSGVNHIEKLLSDLERLRLRWDELSEICREGGGTAGASTWGRASAELAESINKYKPLDDLPF